MALTGFEIETGENNVGGLEVVIPTTHILTSISICLDVESKPKSRGNILLKAYDEDEEQYCEEHCIAHLSDAASNVSLPGGPTGIQLRNKDKIILRANGRMKIHVSGCLIIPVEDEGSQEGEMPTLEDLQKMVNLQMGEDEEDEDDEDFVPEEEQKKEKTKQANAIKKKKQPKSGINGETTKTTKKDFKDEETDYESASSEEENAEEREDDDMENGEDLEDSQNTDSQNESDNDSEDLSKLMKNKFPKRVAKQKSDEIDQLMEETLPINAVKTPTKKTSKRKKSPGESDSKPAKKEKKEDKEISSDLKKRQLELAGKIKVWKKEGIDRQNIGQKIFQEYKLGFKKLELGYPRLNAFMKAFELDG